MERDYSYISVELCPEFIPDIFERLLEAGIQPAPKHDLHATIIYDERDIEKPLCELDPSKRFKANITKLEVLGDGLVFHLTSRDLLDEFARLKEAGYKHSFGTPLPHMSLTYDFNQYDILACQRLFADWGGRELIFYNESFGFKKD